MFSEKLTPDLLEPHSLKGRWINISESRILNLSLPGRELKEKAGFSGFVLVGGEKSSPLISIAFRNREAKEEETVSFPGFENRFSCFSDLLCLLQAWAYYSYFSTALVV